MKKNIVIRSASIGFSALLMMFTGVASAAFIDFVIRDGAGSSPTIQPNATYVPNGLEFVISQGGMKAALGSNDINGSTISQIDSLTITRHDDTTRFAPGSGPAVAPYFNIWVTDGAGHYAVIANEPSNGAFQPLFTINGDGSKTYDLSYSDLADKVAKVYETPGAGTGTSWVHTLLGKTALTFADVASLSIAPPSAAYITNPANAVGSGAPDVLGSNVAYGFNWVFGDTLSNYVSGDEGYVVSSANASAVITSIPEPATMSLLILGLGSLAMRQRRKRS
ncbi:PEP-CTERM protein-sorting domain-containing protein [Nitrosomonas aestuarii]|uniref:PEP-CTERM protein-sorting domain-containing protein n=1 Tax=Nitrosomonas aestuarii TaxID=52441 RepID=A0A1I4AYB5_9PROT|nr:PEP-CTERM sorting domain-containing protein [Nitrosomonas aestuarii]SFK61612.1 PEP-CTERM protein-sorting domain-containing protein [Nitrosomonas aestuarii]